MTEQQKQLAEAAEKGMREAATAAESALQFYADPDTYEQVDILARCGLSSDRDGCENYGVRARAALALLRSALAPATGGSGDSSPAPAAAEPDKAAPCPTCYGTGDHPSKGDGINEYCDDCEGVGTVMRSSLADAPSEACETCGGDGEIDTYPPGDQLGSFLPTGEAVVNYEPCPDCSPPSEAEVRAMLERAEESPPVEGVVRDDCFRMFPRLARAHLDLMERVRGLEEALNSLVDNAEGYDKSMVDAAAHHLSTVSPWLAVELRQLAQRARATLAAKGGNGNG